jgi:hypothetical protein
METIEDILHKDMSRKEFLATLGFGVASLFGIGTMLKFFFGKQQGRMHSASQGYGSSNYGG